MPDLEETLIEIEQAAWDASSSGNGDWYRDNLTEDALLVFPGLSQPMNRSACVETVDAALGSWEWYRMQDVRVVPLADDAAVLTYRAVARRAGEAVDYVASISTVYVRQDGDWKLAFHQQTLQA